jgi:hypothetical protein
MSTSSEVSEHKEGEVNERYDYPKAVEEKAGEEID